MLSLSDTVRTNTALIVHKAFLISEIINQAEIVANPHERLLIIQLCWICYHSKEYLNKVIKREEKKKSSMPIVLFPGIILNEKNLIFLSGYLWISITIKSWEHRDVAVVVT